MKVWCSGYVGSNLAADSRKHFGLKWSKKLVEVINLPDTA